MTADRPTSITGGARYDREPVPGQRPVTVRYFVSWVDATGEIRWVSTGTRWVGARSWALSADHHVVLELLDQRFREQVEVDMRRWPPT